MMQLAPFATAVHAEKLAFLTDIEGVYRDPKDPSTLISELTVSEAKPARQRLCSWRYASKIK